MSVLSRLLLDTSCYKPAMRETLLVPGPAGVWSPQGGDGGQGGSQVITLPQRCHGAESLADLLLRALSDLPDRLKAVNSSNTQG